MDTPNLTKYCHYNLQDQLCSHRCASDNYQEPGGHLIRKKPSTVGERYFERLNFIADL